VDLDRFGRAKDELLLVALTTSEAEERHRANETYALAARLSDGILLLMHRHTGYDRHEPSKDWSSFVTCSVTLLTRLHEVVAQAYCDSPPAESARISSIEVRKRDSFDRIWMYIEDHRENEMLLHDERSGEHILTKRTVTPEDRELLTLRGLAFGEYANFAERMLTLLRLKGFGELS